MTSTWTAAWEEPPAVHVAAFMIEQTEERRSVEDDAFATCAAGVAQPDAT
jgi:hypothetical protein